MKTIQLRLPDNIHSRIKDLSRQEGISMNAYIVSSISNEVIRQETHDFFYKASRQFNSQAFTEALAAIPDAIVPESDKMP